MMKIRTSILLLLFFAATIFGGAEFLRINARSVDNNINITFQTSSETNVKSFVVERKAYNGSFIEVGTVQPRSDKNYEFTDKTAFKSSSQIYIYRIKVIDADGNISHSWEVTVNHQNISSAKKTWGSIKALFR